MYSGSNPMKILSITTCFISVLIAALMIMPLSAQEQPVQGPQQVQEPAPLQEPAPQTYTHGNPAPELPIIEVTIPEIIDILAEYKVVHMDNPVFCRDFYGLTDYFTKTIIICSYDLASRRKTLFHELLHIIYRQRGIGTGGFRESTIDTMATELFHKYYGIPTVITPAPHTEMLQTPVSPENP